MQGCMYWLVKDWSQIRCWGEKKQWAKCDVNWVDMKKKGLIEKTKTNQTKRKQKFP